HVGRRDRRPASRNLRLLPPLPERGASRARSGEDREGVAAPRRAARVMGADRGRVAEPYGELIELAERQQQLLANRDFDGLAETIEIRERLISELPEAAHDHQAARRLLELEEQTQIALATASRGVAIELKRLRTGRAGV